MYHDKIVGCGNGKDCGNYTLDSLERKCGHMSGTHNGWSSCSRLAVLETYNDVRSRKKWCLKPGNLLCSQKNDTKLWLFSTSAAKPNACSKKQTPVTGPMDVGFNGLCPSPSYKSNKQCCCGNDCCWNKCTLENPPDNCLDGLYRGQWMFDSDKGYYIAVKYWEGLSMNTLEF